MDSLKNAFTGQKGTTQQTQPSGGGGGFGGLNEAFGGGRKGEQNEDAIDKGVDLFQQHVMGAGAQDNETAIEQAKDKAIADEIRRRTGRA